MLGYFKNEYCNKLALLKRVITAKFKPFRNANKRIFSGNKDCHVIIAGFVEKRMRSGFRK